ncbi:DNA repair protein, partial [Clostridium butyricum]
YNSIKLKKQSAQISKYLDKVDISFEKLTKDGELKDDFKINYEGKEFNKLSNAEKIKAGLEIANLLINLQNLHFPIFVDNAESINEVPELDTQMIQAKVTTDNEVKVEVIE